MTFYSSPNSPYVEEHFPGPRAARVLADREFTPATPERLDEATAGDFVSRFEGNDLMIPDSTLLEALVVDALLSTDLLQKQYALREVLNYISLSVYPEIETDRDFETVTRHLAYVRRLESLLERVATRLDTKTSATLTFLAKDIQAALADKF